MYRGSFVRALDAAEAVKATAATLVIAALARMWRNILAAWNKILAFWGVLVGLRGVLKVIFAAAVGKIKVLKKNSSTVEESAGT